MIGEMMKWLTQVQMVPENGETVNIWKVVTPGGETGENVRWSVLYSRVRGRPMLRGRWKLYFELYKDWKERMIRVTLSPPLLKVKFRLVIKVTCVLQRLWRQSLGGSNYCGNVMSKKVVAMSKPMCRDLKQSMQTGNRGNQSDDSR